MNCVSSIDIPNASPNQPHLLDKKNQCILGPSLPLTFSILKVLHICLLWTIQVVSNCAQAYLYESTHVANQCELLFSEYGWPDTLISDNGPCYTSQAFTSVMQAFSVNHITSSLHYPQSNGLAEKYIQTVKCLFNKAKKGRKDLYKCLMIYCNTPITGSLQSPVQILHGRSAGSDLSMSNAARKLLENSLKC